jgi:hypothetical protein
MVTAVATGRVCECLCTAGGGGGGCGYVRNMNNTCIIQLHIYLVLYFPCLVE